MKICNNCGKEYYPQACVQGSVTADEKGCCSTSCLLEFESTCKLSYDQWVASHSDHQRCSGDIW